MMPPVLDVRTLVLIYVGIRVGQAAVLTYLWRVQRNYPPARDWALGSLFSAGGLFCFALRDHVPLLLSEIVSNLLLLPGVMLFDFGIARAAGKYPPLALGFAVCAVGNGVLAWFVFVTPNYPAAVLAQNLIFFGFDFYAAVACFDAKRSGDRATFRILGLLFSILLAAVAWRVAGGVFGMTFSFSGDAPRIALITTSLMIFPMITTLLTLHTSKRLQDEIDKQARHDMLTDAFNRRAFGEFADKAWASSVRHDNPLAVLMVDIDHFKDFNDRYGHPTGDAALVHVSRAAQLALRANDIWCRYGGEEFVALLPNTTLPQAAAVAERLRSAVESTVIATPAGRFGLSVSIGVAARRPMHLAWSSVLEESDAALYRAKAAGRNRVVVESAELH